jgi:hypothetical protein
VQTVGGGIKTAIERAHPAVQPPGKVVFAGYLEYQTAGAEIF